MFKKASVVVLLCACSIGIWIYRARSQPDPISMEMFFALDGCPAVVVHIENKPYLLKIDLGSKFALSLQDSVFEAITNKKLDEIAKWRDAKGNFYEAPSYRLPIVKMGNLVLKNILAKKESEEYRANTTLWSDKDPSKVYGNEPIGSLGRPLLEKTNLLFDFQNLQLTACKNLRGLKDVCIDQMTSIPFELDAKGIFLMAKTDVGELRMLLDTGATISLAAAARLQDQECATGSRGFKAYTTQQFQIGGHDFGAKNLLLYDFSPELQADGAIGMDFLDHRIMYVDYQSKMIYLSDKK